MCESPRPRSPKKVIASLAIGVTLGLLLVVGCFCGLRYLFLGRWTLPTTIEFAAIAEEHQHLVQAIYDYKTEHGILPQELADLVPGYLTRIPEGRYLSFNGNLLMIHAGVPHTYVCYSFQFGDEGWSVSGDFGGGPLPVPKPAPTRPALSVEALIVARLAEYDRRIAADRRETTYYVQRNYTQKIVYLLSLGRRAAAMEACRAAAKDFPDWWRPRMSAAVLAGPDEVMQAEQESRAWVEKYPTFIHYWYLCRYYRDRDRHEDAVLALREAVKHSLDDSDCDGGSVPDAYAFDAAAYASQRQQPELVIEITRLWEKPRGVYTYHNDNLDVFRAAAELALGQFDEAKADLDQLFQRRMSQGLWAGNLEQLRRAVAARDRKFVYDPGKLPNGDWELFPPPE